MVCDKIVGWRETDCCRCVKRLITVCQDNWRGVIWLKWMRSWDDDVVQVGGIIILLGC